MGKDCNTLRTMPSKASEFTKTVSRTSGSELNSWSAPETVGTILRVYQAATLISISLKAIERAERGDETIGPFIDVDIGKRDIRSLSFKVLGVAIEDQV